MVRSIFKFLIAFALVSALLVLALNVLPERREVRNPIPHEIALSDPQFLQTMKGVYGSNIEAGHEIVTLVNGDAIFPSMLEAIAEAQDTINFLTYIYWSGEIAEVFANALAAKARDGVAVRVLLDWAGSIPFDQRLIDTMEAAGVVVHRFRPLHWYSIDRLNNRTHRKLLIIDGTVGFTGGVGIGDEWLGNAETPAHWRDNHYRVKGPAVADMQAAFAENWLEASNEVLQGAKFYPQQLGHGDVFAQHIKSSPSGGSSSMHQLLLMTLAASTSHVRIAMAYFVPDEVAIRQLLDLRRRGVKVDIIVPGDNNDVPMARRASRHLWGRLLNEGIRIYEYQPTMYHTKVIIADEQLVIIGSANFDERSLRLNDEAILNVYDQRFAREQIAIFDLDLRRTREVGLQDWENRSVWDQVLDWGASLLRTQL
ncbi:phospholipase D-like domain-containing protein [Corticibacterium sp. UT-5YL-CI-8]|nr:phospholipase D-like domain-containing protein [Tianweitania sp. UT-5YL-CI-8]